MRLVNRKHNLWGWFNQVRPYFAVYIRGQREGMGPVDAAEGSIIAQWLTSNLYSKCLTLVRTIITEVSGPERQAPNSVRRGLRRGNSG
jgi:hypothetical protein